MAMFRYFETTLLSESQLRRWPASNARRKMGCVTGMIDTGASSCATAFAIAGEIVEKFSKLMRVGHDDKAPSRARRCCFRSGGASPPASS
jgi:hypothetical protein